MSAVGCGADSRPLEEQGIQTQGVGRRPQQTFSAEVSTGSTGEDATEETDTNAAYSNEPAAPPTVEQLQIIAPPG